MNNNLIISKYDTYVPIMSLGKTGDQSLSITSLCIVLLCTTSVLSSSSTYGATLNAENMTGSNTIVQNIEYRLGVDLGARTDAELRKTLKENGAGPLYKLLQMAYGKKKKEA